ncbi:MAG TPA: hypothetical protein VEK34_01245 [Methylocella sp.]|nr:hypothetical protein [Methylocella sp.]
MHPVYRELKDCSSDLCQGDIIDAKLLRPALKGHQDYMAERPDFCAFCVMTQTCDLVREQEPAEYITLAVIRFITNVFEKGSNRDRTKRRLEPIIGYQQNKRHYFYLPAEPKAGITAPSVVDLRVTFALHSQHYEQIVSARRIGMNELFAANLGWMTSYVFSRIAMPEWDEEKRGENRDSHIDGLLKLIERDGVSERRKLEITSDEIAAQKVLRFLEGPVLQSLEDIHRKLDDLRKS